MRSRYEEKLATFKLAVQPHNTQTSLTRCCSHCPQDIPFLKLELDSTSSPVVSERQKRKCNHGVILKVVSTNICGSDQHMVRGRTSLPGGHMVLGHEITGEVIECGDDVEFIKKGDLCPMCKAGHTGVCLNVNPARPGAAYGYVGKWR